MNLTLIERRHRPSMVSLVNVSRHLSKQKHILYKQHLQNMLLETTALQNSSIKNTVIDP